MRFVPPRYFLRRRLLGRVGVAEEPPDRAVRARQRSRPAPDGSPEGPRTRQLPDRTDRLPEGRRGPGLPQGHPGSKAWRDRGGLPRHACPKGTRASRARHIRGSRRMSAPKGGTPKGVEGHGEKNRSGRAPRPAVLYSIPLAHNRGFGSPCIRPSSCGHLTEGLETPLSTPFKCRTSAQNSKTEGLEAPVIRPDHCEHPTEGLEAPVGAPFQCGANDSKIQMRPSLSFRLPRIQPRWLPQSVP